MRANSPSVSSQRAEFAQVHSFCTHAPAKVRVGGDLAGEVEDAAARPATPRNPNDPGGEISSWLVCGWKVVAVLLPEELPHRIERSDDRRSRPVPCGACV